MVLLTVLRKRQRKASQARVLLLGLDNAGKSTLVARALGRDLQEVHPTFGFQIETLQHGGLTLNVWDVGGQQSLRPYWHNYFEKTDLLMWVVDATALERLPACARELHAVLGAQDRLTGAGLLVWINKIDAVPAAERTARVAAIERALDLPALQAHHVCRAVVCSAYTGEGVQEGLDYAAAEIAQRLYAL